MNSRMFANASWFIATLLIGLCCRAVYGQSSWIFSPYEIEIWWAVDRQLTMRGAFMSQIEEELKQRCKLATGSTWNLHIQTPPTHTGVLLLRGLSGISAAQLTAAIPNDRLSQLDKLLLLAVHNDAGTYRIEAREWDTRTEQFGALIERDCPQAEALFEACAQAILEAFRPLARIDDVSGSKASLRFRAVGLATEDTEAHRTRPRAGWVLSTVMRQNDRYGHPRPGGIRQIEWTLLVVRAMEGYTCQADVYSINRGYLGGRASSRVDRFALEERPIWQATELVLQSRDASQRPLVGYEIYAKDPDSGQTQFLGHTDWRGQLTIVPQDGHVRVLYVRSGGMLLARLPLLPGQRPTLTARLTDDAKRLQAESLVRSLHATVIDLIAQRELLAARARQLIQQRQFDQAQQILDQLRRLPTVTDIRQRIDRGRQETATDNQKIQAIIDKMFVDIQQFVVKRLDPNLIDRLANELASAQRSRS